MQAEEPLDVADEPLAAADVWLDVPDEPPDAADEPPNAADEPPDVADELLALRNKSPAEEKSTLRGAAASRDAGLPRLDVLAPLTCAASDSPRNPPAPAEATVAAAGSALPPSELLEL